MKAMILAAGRGARMKPFTDDLPKPLLAIGPDESLLSRHLTRLKEAGITEIVINHAWLGKKIEAAIGDGKKWGVTVRYSPEGETGLETAGGIAHALPLLGDDIFLVVNGDIYTDFDFSAVFSAAERMRGQNTLAHLWFVPNPPHHPEGDYAIDPEGYLAPRSIIPTYTFSGIALYQPRLFAHLDPNCRYKLAALFNEVMKEKKITASVFTDLWLDVGTPERLQALRKIRRGAI